MIFDLQFLTTKTTDSLTLISMNALRTGILLLYLCCISFPLFAELPDLLALRNTKELLPFRDVSERYVCLTIGKEGKKFQQIISEYAPTFSEFMATDSAMQAAFPYLCNSKKVIIGLFENADYASPKHFGISGEALKFIRALDQKTDVVLVVFGRPLALPYFMDNSTIIYSKFEHTKAQSQAGQALFGAIGIRKPLNMRGIEMTIHTGELIQPLSRLQFDVQPEAVGMSSRILNQIDLIAQNAISSKATPGCQVLVARHGKVVFNKAYGHYTYDRQVSVTDNSLYDVASLTKVLVTVPVLMQLVQAGKIDVNKKASEYLPDLKQSNKKDLTIKQILLHKAGLSPNMPGWFETFHTEELFRKYYMSAPSKSHPIQVTENVYAPKHHEDSLWSWVKNSPLSAQRRDGSYGYRYGDMGFFILKKICEKILQMPMNQYVETEFFEPLALQKMTYLPLQKHQKTQIVPSGYDPYFRKTTLQGFVHDYAAGMIGGVSGHAGIFSNAKDIAILMQIFLQDGYYGGKKYFTPEVISQFTSAQNPLSSRGLGWDKPRAYGKMNPASNSASAQAFGHRGFTGTCVWVDPRHELIYVFLSNRTFPSYKNQKLLGMKVRRRIHDVIYQAIK